MDNDCDLLVAIEQLAAVHDRFDVERSDPSGTSAGDDGSNADGRFDR